MPKKKTMKGSARDQKEYVGELISRIVRECPRRQPTSEDERRSQVIMKEEFENLGICTEFQDFEFNDNLYANIALHFGLGTLGTMVSGVFPLGGLALHGLASGSYWADSTRKAYILRRLLGFKPSQNLLATMPAEGPPDLRIVFLAHADAAFTGLLFDPEMVKRFSGEPPKGLGFIKRSMSLATRTQAALAGFDTLRIFLGPLTWPLRPLEYVLTIPAMIALGLNLQVVLKNEIVPGANDNLSGVAALPILAQRLGPAKPANVEYVFGITGCEEASLGGGDALAKAMDGVWDKDKTVIIGLDGLSNGDLNFAEVEGEVVKTPIPQWLGDVARQTAASDKKFEEVKGFEIPVGGTDIAAFLAQGWQGVSMICVDPQIGAPRNYHTSEDTPENLDYDKLMFSIEFTEKLAQNILKRRLG